VMGAAEGVSEANANRQWEMYMASINSFQDDLASMMERQYTTALNAQGLQADVEIKFKQVRASEAYRDAQALLTKLTAAEKAENLGYIGQDEGAIETYGHPAVRKRDERPAEIGADSSDPVTEEDGLPKGDATEGEPDTNPDQATNQSRWSGTILDLYGNPITKR
jgi:hypothetical protein